MIERSAIFEERLEKAEYFRLEGNNHFKDERFDAALQSYEASLYQSEFDEAQMAFELLDHHVQKVYEARYLEMKILLWFLCNYVSILFQRSSVFEHGSCRFEALSSF